MKNFNFKEIEADVYTLQEHSNSGRKASQVLQCLVSIGAMSYICWEMALAIAGAALIWSIIYALQSKSQTKKESYKATKDQMLSQVRLSFKSSFVNKSSNAFNVINNKMY
jgi:hypothetical protein